MPLNRLLLRIMLVSLAASALAGVAAMLLGGQEIIWRVMSTSFFTALTSGLLIPVSMRLEQPRFRAMGLGGMAALVFEFLLILAAIWWPMARNSFFPGDEQFTISALIFAPIMVVLFVALWLVSTPGGRIAGWTMVTLCLVDYSLWLVPLWWSSVARWVNPNLSNSYWDTLEHLYMTAAAFSSIAPFPALALVGVGTDRRHWRWLGVAAGVAAFIVAVFGIWMNIHEDTGLFTCIFTISILTAHANLVFLTPLNPAQRWLRWVALAAALLTGFAVDAMVVLGLHDDNAMLPRLAGAAAIVAACSSIALLVLWRLNRRVHVESQPKDITSLTLICPRCGKKQTAALNESVCGECGLLFRIQVVEPRCPKCDYLLYGANVTRCPECGADTTEHQLLSKRPPIAAQAPGLM